MSNRRNNSTYARRGASGELLLDVAQFRRLRDALSTYSGVYIDDGRQRQLEHGLTQRLAATGLPIESYLRLSVGPEGRGELHLLAELVLNHETMFFRNMPHMRGLQDEVLPELHRRKRLGAPLRIWSAGCATGEEAYSLAITALEALGRPPGRPVEIVGTDLSEGALARARAGLYRGRALSNLSPALRQRYFGQQGEYLAVSDEVRRVVRFERLNLLDPFPLWAQGVDLIFCQNVTIYFQVATCRALMERFYQALPEGGMLFLGFSETMWHIFNRFLTREIAGGFVYYKESSQARRGAADQTVGRGEPGRAGGKTAPLMRKEAAPRPEPARVPRPSTAPAPEQRSEDGSSLLRRSRALLEGGEAERALELLRRLPPDSDQTPDALTLIARAHADRNDLDMALAEALRARELSPLSTEAHMLLGLIYSRLGQWQAAIDQLERARYLDGAAPLVSFYLAEAYRQRGRAEAAAREYRNAIQKLAAHPPDTLLDGVAVGWIRETCQRYVQQMMGTGQRGV